MSIHRLSDAEVAQRIMPTDERAKLEALATQITEQGRYSVALFDYPHGIHVQALNGSGGTVIDEQCDLPNNSDDMFTAAGKRKFIRLVKERLRLLLVDNTRPAA